MHRAVLLACQRMAAAERKAFSYTSRRQGGGSARQGKNRNSHCEACVLVRMRFLACACTHKHTMFVAVSVHAS